MKYYKKECILSLKIIKINVFIQNSRLYPGLAFFASAYFERIPPTCFDLPLSRDNLRKVGVTMTMIILNISISSKKLF